MHVIDVRVSEGGVAQLECLAHSLEKIAGKVRI